MRTGIRALLTIAVAACCLIGTQGAGATDPAPSIGFAAGASTTVTAPGKGNTITVDLGVSLSNADGSGALSAQWATDDGSQNGTVDFDNTADATTQIEVDVTGTDAQTITVTLTGDAVDPGNATATVTVDAAPTATIPDTAEFQGEPTDRDETLPVTLSAPPSSDVTVHYTSTQATAKSGIDYTLPGDGTVTIAKGATEADIPITILAATSGGAFTIDLTAVDGGAVLGPSGTETAVTIDPAPLPVLSVAGTTVAAKPDLDVALAFPVALSQPAATPVTVTFTTAFGTALQGQDYNLVPPFTTTIPAGATSGTVPIRIMAGSTGGTFTLTLQSSSANATIDPAHATATITITPAPLPQPTISIASTTVAAGASDATASIPVNLSTPATSDVTVDYAATTGTAISNVDYVLPSGTLHIPAGLKSASIAFTVKGGSLGGTFTVTLSKPANAVLDANGATAHVTIAPAASAALPVLSVADVAVAAGAGDTAGTLAVQLSAKAAADVTVAYAASDGTAKSGTDYVLPAGTLTIPAGQVKASIPFTVKAGTGGGTFTVALSSPSANATLDPAASGATVTIVTGPALSIADTSVAENDPSGDATVTVTLVGTPTGSVTVAYATSDGTATAPADYAQTSGTLAFANGETTKTIAIPIVKDTQIEGTEQFAITLSKPTNATLSRARATVTIRDTSATVSTGSGSVGFGGQNLNGIHVPVAQGSGSVAGLGGSTTSGGSGGTGGSSSSGSAGGAGGSSASGGKTGQSPSGSSTSHTHSAAARVTVAAVSPWLTSKSLLRVRIGCPAAAKTRCTGTVTVVATVQHRRLTLGTSRLRIGRGRASTVPVRINPAGLALLRHARSLKATLLVALAPSADVALRSARTVTLRAGSAPPTSVTLSP